MAALHHRVRRQAEILTEVLLRGASSGQALPEPRKLLLVVIGLIGDSIMCTPALSEARRLLPAAEIHVLTTSANEQLIRNSGWADVAHVYDGPAFPRRGAARRELRDLEGRLRLRAFDTAVILLGDDFVPLLCRARIARRVGIAGTACARLLTDRYQMGDVRTWGPEQKLGALRCFGLAPRSAVPRLDLLVDRQDSVPRVLREMGVESGFLLLHPFGSTPNRMLPIHQSAELADMLAAGCNRHILIIGGPGDREGAEQIVSRCVRRDRVHAAAGRFSLAQTGILMQHADVTLTTDSGPLHMAGALGRPVVGLFRAIRPEYAQLYPTVAPLFWPSGPACLPACTWDSWYGCAVSPCRQLAGIDNSRVVAAVSDCLSRGAADLARTL